MSPRKYIHRLRTLEGCKEFSNDFELYLKNQRKNLLAVLAEDSDLNRDLAEVTLGIANRNIDELGEVQSILKVMHLEDNPEFYQEELREARERIMSLVWGDIHPNSQYGRKRAEESGVHERITIKP